MNMQFTKEKSDKELIGCENPVVLESVILCIV